MKYTVGIPYTGWKYFDVEADSEEEAIEKVFEQNEIEERISLCYSCAESLDSDLELVERDIYTDSEV